MRAWVCGVLLVLPAVAFAQLPIPIPKTLALPNYDAVLVGKEPSLEGGAYIARANDASANIYDAAGLLNADRTALNASSNGYLVSKISSKSLDTSVSGTTIDALPGFIGFLLGSPQVPWRSFRFGFAATRTQSWTPPGFDESFEPTTTDALSRVTYSSRSSFRTELYQVAAAWSPLDSRALRLGLTVGLAQTSLDIDTTLSGEVATASGPASFLGSLRATTNSNDLAAGLSAQWDCLPGLTLGARLIGPGLEIGTGSTLTYEANLLTPGLPKSYFFRDEQGKFQYKQPIQAGLGVAYRFGPVQLEADVRYHGAESQYDLYRSDLPIQQLEHNPDGTTTSTNIATPIVVYSARHVVNFAVGGNGRITQALKVHAGFYTSRSPVADPANSQFRQANLYGLTGGGDVQFKSFGFSLGLGYLFGSATPTGFGEGTAIERVSATSVDLRAISILYAFSYEF